jgi:hypothetical protein
MFDPTPINKFMTRVRQAAVMNAKDIKLTTSEALELSACLVQVLASQVSTLQTTKKETLPVKPNLDGGGFTKEKQK